VRRKKSPVGRRGSQASQATCDSPLATPIHAVAVDPEAKDAVLKRLRRIEGQIRGLQKMVEEERYCADVLTQIASAHEALRSVGRILMKSHLRHCATHAIRSGDRDAAEAMYEELVELMYRNAR